MLILVFAALSANPTAPPCAQCLAPGTVVVGVTCDLSDPTQQGWAFDTAAGHITHADLCLSVTAWGLPLNLYSCGNKTTHQTFAFDNKTRHFEIQAPANTPTLYPADLEVVKGPGIQKAYVYRPNDYSTAMEWTVANGVFRNDDTMCLAARAKFVPPAPACTYPQNCPNQVLPRADKQTWVMNKSTIIMPCNNTGFTDPKTTLGWGVVDFDWSNAKGTGTADGWAKHSPMDDEEMLFQQVKMTAAATPGTTVWVYRCSIYAYPWYTSVRTILDDPAYAAWFIDFKPEGPWRSPKCDNNFSPPKCSDHYHMQEQTPGFPHGDGDCAAPGCDCGKAPCGFYLWNHSSTAVINGQTFQHWFIHDYMLDAVGMSPLVSGFFWDDFWPKPGQGFPDAVHTVAEDTGLDQEPVAWGQITDAYHTNMDVLRNATLTAGKFAWQLMWTGGSVDGVGSTIPHPIVQQGGCAAELRALCNETAPPQTRAMMYALNAHRPDVLPELKQDLANFLLIRGPFAWLGHGWKGCSQSYPFPLEFNLDYGEPIDTVCKETAPHSGVFTREWSKASVKMDCATWTPTITMK